MTTGLVGRAAELAEGVCVVVAPPSVLCVAGPAGIGKSRLVAEILADRQVRTRRVLRGVCLPGSGFPRGPVFEAVRGCGPLRTVPSPVTGALSAYLPELAAWLPEALPALPDPAAERHRLFRAVRDLLEALTPAVLVVEDVQWADDETRCLLAYLAAHPVDRLSVVVSCRGEPAGLPGEHVITLSTLDRRAVRELALAIVPGLAERVLAELPAHTGGRPDLVVGTVLGLVRTGEDDVAVVEPPDSVRRDTARLLAALDAPARALVETAAVIGVPVAANVLGRAAGIVATDVVAAAVRSGLLVESGIGRYSVEPGAVRRCVRDQLAAPVLRRAHARALRVLRAEPEQPAARLAEHARAAGKFSD
ncbi:AAA family ATPase [Lentzea flava]|uniref:Orc1-like AAA ATPase domain-containing protein n=1 Tax=Lentzea flava TaxID=103732 RepID=A0ABQ2UCR9_9PSEU|nr:AAA family ATPase [Lentzea flava]MCP2196547.1 AAA ATPase domain-containing protein [Lentzea flava]GGU17195.1 hypothetical protein GCM10010178_06260 [Lentzea flava]